MFVVGFQFEIGVISRKASLDTMVWHSKIVVFTNEVVSKSHLLNSLSKSLSSH